MKLVYVTAYDAADVRNWSGLGYFIAHSLSAQSISVERIGPLAEKYALLFKGKQAVYQYLLKQTYLRDREPTILKDYARQVERKLRLEHDIVFSPGTIPIAYLEKHATDRLLDGRHIRFEPRFLPPVQRPLR